MGDASTDVPRAMDAGALSFNVHDAAYANDRPDGKARAQQGGGADHSPYTAVETNNLEHYADMVDSTVMPLFDRADQELAGIGSMAPGHFPHADAYGQRIMKMRDDYAARVTELHGITRAMSGVMRGAGRHYATAEEANAMSFGDVAGLPKDGAGGASPGGAGTPPAGAPPAAAAPPADPPAPPPAAPPADPPAPPPAAPPADPPAPPDVPEDPADAGLS